MGRGARWGRIGAVLVALILLALGLGLLVGCGGGSTPAATPGVTPPVAGFTASSATALVGQTVQFTDTSTGSPTGWAWSFGDGAASSAQHPGHAWASPGTWTVTLTASNAGGGSSASRTVAVTVAPPTAAFTFSPAAPVVGQAVAFTDGSSGSPTGWAWSFGDGGASTGQNPVHAFTAAGTWTVTLTARNAGGAGSVSHPVTVVAAPPAPPTAAFTFSPAAPVAGQAVAFTDGSTGSPTGWEWSFGDGGASTSQNPGHAFAAAGTWTVTLTARNAGGAGSVSHPVTVAVAALAFPVVDTGQTRCYDAATEIAAPAAGQAFYGQDAQHAGRTPSLTLSADGRTVLDGVTGLRWMRGPNTTLATPVTADKKTWAAAQAWPATVNAQAYGGYTDWRLPTLQELYSLIDFRGTDPSSYAGTDTSVLTPFLDPTKFNFAYGSLASGERIIDSQYATSELFVVNPAETGSPKLFGVNFADGRIKGYDLSMPGGASKTFFVQLVRGAAGYGRNAFSDRGDGTVLDAATGLMWTRADNGAPLLWQEALAWVQARNAANHLGHADWRLPDVKELHSLVNLANAPDFNGLPALDTAFFTCTPIVNENGDADYPYYWSATTHAGYGGSGGQAAYVPFGRALGWPDSAGRWVDVHGAGCQRSDPKVGPPYAYATVHTVLKGGLTYTGYAHGPQGDAIRGRNFVRLVRNGD